VCLPGGGSYETHEDIERQVFMGLILTGFFCAWAALPARAEEWSKTYSLTGKPDLRVETSDANIHVSTWDQNTIEARVTTTGYKIGDGGIRSKSTRRAMWSRSTCAIRIPTA
jgi:hypothetical protein